MTEMNKDRKIQVSHLSSVHPFFDTRILLKQCKSLEQAGFKVTLTARKEDGLRETIDGVDVIPFPIYRNRLKRILLSPFKMVGMARKQKADIYHFHDPELLPVGVMLKLLGKKVIYDVHEDYSKQLLYKPWLKSRVLKRIMAGSFRLFEKVSILFIDRIVAATPDIATRFPARKTVTVRNVPMLNLIRERAPFERDEEMKKTGAVIIYAGSLAGVRGTKEIIEAMAMLEKPAQLWLLGKWESNAFAESCAKLDGWKHVKYLGFTTPAEVYGYMKAADIGLSVLYPIKNYLTSLPVKAFEYMACGVPMIMSDFPFWQEIFGDCAMFTDPREAEKIAAQINILLNDKELAGGMSRKGEALVIKHYSWEEEKKNLINIYEEIA